MSSETIEIITALTKISTPAWEALVWQTRMYGILRIAFSILLLFILTACFKRASMLPAKVKYDEDDDKFSEKEGLILVAIVSFFIMITLLFGGILRFVNPFYYAVQSLIGK